MSFHDLEFLALFPLALGLFLWRRNRLFLRLKSTWSQRLGEVPRSWRARLSVIPIILFFFGLSLLILALARPQKESAQVKRNLEGIDIMIVLDISDSMMIEDMRPLNRLEAAKETIQKFVQRRSSDRIGVIVFAGESFTLVPLTLDYELLVSRISELKTAREARIKDGTALGVALANGAGRLKDSTAKSRVLVFLTDGENNSGTIDPETGLEIAKGYGIKIYSIGIGQDGPTRIPTFQKDPFGREIKTYQPFESRVNDDLLSRMARETGGQYFRATQPNSLQKVFEDIDRLEKTVIEENRYTRRDELFKPILVLGFCLLALSWTLSQVGLRRFP